MRIALALAIMAAACGEGRGPVMPQGRPVVRLVRCAAATPMPQVVAADDDERDSVLRLAVHDASSATERVLVRAVTVKPVTVTLGVPTITGGLTPAKLLAVMRTKLGELGACWQQGAAIRSAVIYTFTIAATGRVSVVNSTSKALGSDADTCVKRVVRSMVFPGTTAEAQVSIAFIFDTSPNEPKPPDLDVEARISPWTPYAVDTSLPGAGARGAARATEAAVRGRLAAIEGCFAGPTPTGSLRVMLEINIAGELGTVRTGGLGDARAEACVTKAFEGMHVATPMDEHVEVACDLARGDAQPWRVAPAAGYSVIDIERTQLRHGKDTLVPGASDPVPLPVNTYLVLARPQTPGAMVQLALLWANDASAVVLGLVDDKPGAIPLFLGIGHTAVTQGDDGDGETVRPALRVNAKTVTGCVNRATQRANVSDPAAVGALVQRLATKCRSITCTPTLLVAIDSDAVTKDLAEITGAARRAGFERVLFGGSELGCQEVAPASRKPGHTPIEKDAE